MMEIMKKRDLHASCRCEFIEVLKILIFVKRINFNLFLNFIATVVKKNPLFYTR